MTIILIAAGFFALGLTVILLFRKTISDDDELDRRWAEVVAQRPRRGASPSAPEKFGGSANREDLQEPAEPGRPT